MSKAINWPQQFLNEVINENTDDLKVAFRLGSIYYDHCYYVTDEIVDIRVNHKIIRQGQIIGNLKLCKICELVDNDLSMHKQDINTIEGVVNYLSKTYEQEVDPDTTITVIYYRNMGSQKNINRADDPHS